MRDGREDGNLEQQVAEAETELLDAEVDFATLQVELDNFALLHHRVLGPLYERLDELDALTAEAVAARTGDPEDIRRAVQIRALVEPMPDFEELMAAAGGATSAPDQQVHRVKPAEEAKRIYRELARRAHPDLVQDETEKRRRDTFIARVNAAYARGDVEQLKALDAEWAAGPQEAAAETEPLAKRLEWLRERRRQLADLRETLLGGPMGQLLQLAPDDPDGLLKDLAEQLLGRVEEKEKLLAAVLAA